MCRCYRYVTIGEKEDPRLYEAESAKREGKNYAPAVHLTSVCMAWDFSPVLPLTK